MTRRNGQTITMENPTKYWKCKFRVSQQERIEGDNEFKRAVAQNLGTGSEICIYVLCDGPSFIYVGSAKNVGNTITSGCNRDYPYKWLEPYRGRMLQGHFFSFDEDFGAERPEHIREAIEGEVVYEIRERTGAWPKYQNEIHFRENLRSMVYDRGCVALVLERLCFPLKKPASKPNAGFSFEESSFQKEMFLERIDTTKPFLKKHRQRV